MAADAARIEPTNESQEDSDDEYECRELKTKDDIKNYFKHLS